MLVGTSYSREKPTLKEEGDAMADGTEETDGHAEEGLRFGYLTRRAPQAAAISKLTNVAPRSSPT